MPHPNNSSNDGDGPSTVNASLTRSTPGVSGSGGSFRPLPERPEKPKTRVVPSTPPPKPPQTAVTVTAAGPRRSLPEPDVSKKEQTTKVTPPPNPPRVWVTLPDNKQQNVEPVPAPHDVSPPLTTSDHHRRAMSMDTATSQPLPSFLSQSTHESSSRWYADAPQDDNLFKQKKKVFPRLSVRFDSSSQKKQSWKDEEKRLQDDVGKQTPQSPSRSLPVVPPKASPDPPPSSTPRFGAALRRKSEPVPVRIPLEDKADEGQKQKWKRMTQAAIDLEKRQTIVGPTIKVRVHRVDPSAMAFGGDSSDTPESRYFRSRFSKAVPRKVAKYVMDATNEDSLFAEMATTEVVAPEHMPMDLLIRFFFRHGTTCLRPIEVTCKRFQSLKEAVMIAMQDCGIAESVWSGCVVRVHGQRRYVIRPDQLTTPLENFCHVRECVLRKRLLEFVIEPPRCENMLQYLEQPPLPLGTFGNIDCEPDEDCEMVTAIPISSLPASNTFRPFVVSVDSLPPDIIPRGISLRRNFVDSGISFSVGVTLYYNHTRLSQPKSTEACIDGTWNEYVDTGIPLAKLMRESHFVVTLMIHQKQRVLPVAWGAVSLFDENGFLRSGLQELHLWRVKNEAKEVSVNHVVGQNPQINALKMLVRIDGFNGSDGTPSPVFWDYSVRPPSRKTMLPPSSDELEKKRAEVEAIMDKDSRGSLTDTEKWQMWHHREFVCLEYPNALPTVLMCAKWDDAPRWEEVSCLLSQWPRLQPINALVLLGPDFIDTSIRNYAVGCLEALSDEELIDLLPPLVQALKYDQYFYSADRKSVV